jgi:hypothetical protein
MTLAAREYDAEQDCRRLGLHAYLPQMRKSWLPRGAQKPMLRSVPLFPRYLFVPIHEARSYPMRHVRGLPGHRFLLASAEGRIWECPGPVIAELVQAEKDGRFDEVPPELGSKVRMKGKGALSTMDLLISCLDDRTAEILTPLFGGVSAKVKVADLVRAV